MPTPVTCTVDPGGTGDYTSWANADSDLYGATSSDLVGNDENIECSCICTNGSPDTASVTASDFTTDATRNIAITVPSAYRHLGIYPASGNIYRIGVEDDQCFYLNYNDHYVITGVAFRRTYSAVQYSQVLYVQYASGTPTFELNGCIGSAQGANFIFYFAGSAGTFTAKNCLAYDSGRTLFANAGTGTAYAYGCTSAKCSYDSGGEFSGFDYIANCISCGHTYAGHVQLAADTSENCASDDGASIITLDSSSSYVNEFVDYTNNNYHLVAISQCVGSGKDLTGILDDDIDEQNRLRFDIGCDEAGSGIYTVVDPGGTGDYTSITNAESDNFGASAANLMTADEYTWCECICTNATAESAHIGISGQTTDLARCIKVFVDKNGGYYHDGVYPSGNKFRVEVTNADGVTIADEHVEVNGLAVNVIGNDSAAWHGIDTTTLAASNFVKILNNLIRTQRTAGTGALSCIYSGDADTISEIKNNICYNDETYTSSGYGIYCHYGVSHTVVNNTIRDTYYGIRANSTVRNTLAINNLACNIGVVAYTWAYLFDEASDYNVSDNTMVMDTNGNGENNLTEQSFSFISTTAGSENLHLNYDDTGAINHGIGPGSNSNVLYDDIDGDARSGSTTDAGADLYVSTTTAAPTTAATTTPPTTLAPTTLPTTLAPTTIPTTLAPTTLPTTLAPTTLPTTLAPTTVPTTLPPTTLAPTTAAPFGSVCWGNTTISVEEDVPELFHANWTGTAEIDDKGTIDDDKLRFYPGDFSESPTWHYGVGRIKISLDKYNTGFGTPTILYKNGSSQANCEADSWHNYVSSFICDGWVKVRLEV